MHGALRAPVTVIAIAVALCNATAAFADEDLAARIGAGHQVVRRRIAGAAEVGHDRRRSDRGDRSVQRRRARDWGSGVGGAGLAYRAHEPEALKLRNPANAPDAWELAALRDFEARKAAEEGPATLDRAGFAVVDGKRTFRYMKAIGTQPVCTLRHGAAIAPEVAAALDALYPEDRARGFAVIDIRGAFSIVQPAP